MADRGEDGGDGGAGEDVAADRGVEHAPTNPACAGSWPEPPPEMMATLDLSTLERRVLARTTTLMSGRPSRSWTLGCDCTNPWSISTTASLGSFRNL